MKKLYLIRHAKSSWSNHELEDIDRPLNDRGKHDAPRMGKYLAHRAEKAEIIFSSPALRAISTARAIQENWKSPSNIEEEVKLYEGNTSEILDLINQIDDAISWTRFSQPHDYSLGKLLLTRRYNVPLGLAILQFNKNAGVRSKLNGNLPILQFPKNLKSINCQKTKLEKQSFPKLHP